MSPIHVVASTNEDLLQDPHLRVHVSTSLCLRLLCKIHVSGFMSQHPCVSQDPLQDPRLRIHVSASLYLTDSLQDPRQRLRIHVSASLYLRILCKIHVSGSMSPIHVSASICISGSSARSMSPIHFSASLYLRVLCKIHVFGFMSQHLRVSRSSARSMSSDPYTSTHMYLRILCKICLRIHVSAAICISGTSARSMSPDPYISIHMYLKLLCKIHVSGSVYQHPYVSQDPLRDPCLRIHVSASTCISATSARSMSPDP